MWWKYIILFYSISEREKKKKNWNKFTFLTLATAATTVTNMAYKLIWYTAQLVCLRSILTFGLY